MKNLNFYSEDCFTFYEAVVDSKNITKKDPLYKDRLKKLNHGINAAFSIYCSAFNSNSLEAIKPTGYALAEKEDLQQLYSFSNSKIQELLRIVTTTKNNRKRSVCPNCTIGEVNSFDHILPQGEFSEFIVNPLNLVPSCSNCNSRKSRFYAKDGKKLFLNLYIDKIPRYQYLHADITVKSILEIEIRFYLFKPDGMNEDFYNLISSHYNKLKLIRRFSDHTDDVVTEFENSITPYLSALPRTDIEDCVKEILQKDKALYGLNHWRCVLKNALLNNKEYMKRFDVT